MRIFFIFILFFSAEKVQGRMVKVIFLEAILLKNVKMVKASQRYEGRQ